MHPPKEDVYESNEQSDADLMAKFAKPETNNPNDVELIHIDVDAAKKKFAGRILNCKDVDFSDSIAKKRRQAYGSSAYVIEVVGKDYGEAETMEQKFNRLTYELAELAEEVKKSEGTATNELVTENGVSELMDELMAAKIAKTTNSPHVLPQHKVAKESKPRSTDLTALEARIGRIERVIGSTGERSAPLIDTLDDIKLRVDTLNSSFLDGIESRLNSLINKHDQVEGRKKQGENGELEEKVDSLYNLMSKWDSTCTNLPSNVKRLQALRALHEQASEFSERVSQLVGMKDEMNKAASSSRLAVTELQAQMKEEIGSLLKQISSLEARAK